MTRRPGNKGFSLIELLIVIGLIAILLAVAIPPFSEWYARYNIESQVRKLYADLQLKTQATLTNRIHWVTGDANSYTITADANDSGALDDAAIKTVNVQYPMVTSAGSLIASPSCPAGALCFNVKGLANVGDDVADTAAVCVISNVTPEYDCIRIGRTRLQLGKLNGGVCNAVACVAR